ncbi:MAG: discoidin domain-containing protein [Bacteroidaceae bacterium]|nr:discoidin domain-containing protein [Bacteroidaceae bacterium]
MEHFYAVMDSDGRVLDGNAAGGTLAGWDKNIPTTTGGNNCYHFLPLEFIDAEIWTVYQKGLSAAASLPYAIQQAYGVTDFTKYTSNAKEANEGSIEALIDNSYNDPSFFHSSYSAKIGDYHYLQVEVAESIKDFYFYFKKRQGNNYNRPTEIEIQGSADGQEFTTIKTISEGLPVDAGVLDYMSDVVNASATVKYIRFVVKQTNSGAKDAEDGHPFFTFSEFYVFSSNNDVASLVASYKAFASSSFLSPDLESVVEDLVNAESVLSLANIKKEIKSVLDANESNHAATPALGQYTTTAYNALKAAYNAAGATQESLEKAIEDFRYAKNLPVFTIDGVVSYASGKSIYDGEAQNDKGNTHYFKTTNLYDKTMWWALDFNTTTVGVAEEVGIYNVGTHKNFWNSSTIKITETNENDGAGITDDGIFLFYTTGNNTPIHYQEAGSLITRWDSYDAASASAHKFTYVGNTYELANLTDEKIQALAALKTAYDAKAYYKNAVVGDGLGQYKGNKDAIVAELAKAEAVYMKTISQQANMTVEEINAIAKSITDVAALTLNMPSAGFYRIASMNSSLHPENKGKFIQSDGGNLKLAETKDVNSILYLDGSNMMISYALGSYLNNYSAPEAKGGAGSAWTFIENAQVIGTYTLDNPADKQGGEQYFLSDWTGNVTYGGNDVNAAWMFEEVAELPITISPVGYATFYCPVAVTLPEGLNAYYVSSIANDKAQMTKISEVIPANTGVVLQGEPKSYTLTIGGEADGVTNLLDGTVASTYVELESYVLSQNNDVVGFYKAAMNFAKNGEEPWAKVEENGTHFLNNAFKAYLPASVVPLTARFLSFDFGTETAIENIEGAENAANAVIYDLSGRRVQKAQKGLYIVNGVKVIK